jgi:hypothetical protein
MTVTKAMVSIQKRGPVEKSDRGAKTARSDPLAGPLVNILVVNMLGEKLDADDVENLAVRIEAARDFHLLPLVLLRFLLVIKLIQGIIRYLQDIPAAVLSDRTHERWRHWLLLLSRRGRRLLVRLLCGPIRRRHRLGHWLGFLKLRPGDQLRPENVSRKRRARLSLRILREHQWESR